MSSVNKFRHIFRDLSLSRLWGAWARSYFVNTVYRRCRRDRVVREVLQRFRQTFLRPRRTLLLSATAAYRKADDEATSGCDTNITDQELEDLIGDLDNVEELSHKTLYCVHCDKRVVVDKRHPGVLYCGCKDTRPSDQSYDGWTPFMETEDVIIWRKEYREGQGLYAYKIYGRYKEIRAEDFAAIQLDGEYRRVWDSAVAALSLVAKDVNGVRDQDILHWEVLWPKLFTNRDYVYIRRYKDLEMEMQPFYHKDKMFGASAPDVHPHTGTEIYHEWSSVHSSAKRRSERRAAAERRGLGCARGRAFVILSRACAHAAAPETRRAVRVTEYWSHMVIRTLAGDDRPGMEYVLTYYDEPATGALPAGVAAWATGRAAPAYLARMRRAAARYAAWRAACQDAHEFDDDTEPIDETKDNGHGNVASGTESIEEPREKETQNINAMLQHKTLPEENTKKIETRESADGREKDSNVDEMERSEQDNNRSWWKYMYPFYYFI